MQRSSLILVAAAVFCGTLQLFAPAPAGADPAAMATTAPVDCSKADAMMHDAMMSMPSPAAMTGSMDKKFTDMMMAQNKANMKMANVESQCGKSQKVRDMAKAAMAQLEAEAQRLQTIISNGY
jgi:uncharacterized protein (DUF305 family)